MSDDPTMRRPEPAFAERAVIVTALRVALEHEGSGPASEPHLSALQALLGGAEAAIAQGPGASTTLSLRTARLTYTLHEPRASELLLERLDTPLPYPGEPFAQLLRSEHISLEHGGDGTYRFALRRTSDDDPVQLLAEGLRLSDSVTISAEEARRLGILPPHTH